MYTTGSNGVSDFTDRVGEDTAVVSLLRELVTAISQLGVLLVALVLLMATGTYLYKWREPEKIMIETIRT